MQAVVVPNAYSVDSCRHGVGGYKRLDGSWACPHLSSRKFQSHPTVPPGRLIGRLFVGKFNLFDTYTGSYTAADFETGHIQLHKFKSYNYKRSKLIMLE